jgi:uncharacterized protein YdhG (YjbR/CyaY superfamily)
VLNRIRAIIRNAVPRAEEAISYQIPAYKLDGRPVIYFAGWKQHYSIYPATSSVVAALEKELAPYKIGKGTIRFPLSERVPALLIGRIVKLRVKQATEQAKGKAKPERTRPAKVRIAGGAGHRSK